MKGLLLDIYESKCIGNCSNNGISSRCKTVTLVGEGIDPVFEANDSRPAVKLVRRNFGGREYLHVEPIVGDEPGMTPAAPNTTSFMHGGCYVDASDSRWRVLSQYPVALHDRRETWEEYRTLTA